MITWKTLLACREVLERPPLKIFYCLNAETLQVSFILYVYVCLQMHLFKRLNWELGGK